MTLLLASGTLLGAAMMLAIFFVDRLGVATWLMVFAGAATVYVAMGCLSRDVPRFKLALVFTLLACATAAVATMMTLTAATELEQGILRNSRPRYPGDVVVVYVETERGARLATLRLAWKLGAAATVTNLVLAAYLPVRLGVVALARRRRPIT